MSMAIYNHIDLMQCGGNSSLNIYQLAFTAWHCCSSKYWMRWNAPLVVTSIDDPNASSMLSLHPLVSLSRYNRANASMAEVSGTSLATSKQVYSSAGAT